MKKLWFYFNTLQVTDSLVKFRNVKMPANMELVKKAYNDIIHVKMIPDELMDGLLQQLGISSNETSAEATNVTHTSAGHRSLVAEPSKSSIKRNRFIVVGVIGCILITLLLVCLCRKRIWDSLSRKRKQQVTSFYRMIFWNMFIRTGSELYYPMLLAACYTLMENRKTDYKNIAIAVVFSAYLVFTPIFMYQHREVIGSSQFQELYGAYTTNLETYKKPKAVQYPFIFLLRRTSLVLIIVFLRRNIVAQVLSAVHSSLLMLTWLIQVKPFDAEYKNKLECFNEFIVLVMSYIDFLFTDYVDNPVLRYTFGYFYIGIIAFGLLVNVTTMGAATIADFVKACKRRKNKPSAKIAFEVKPVNKISFAPTDFALMPRRNSFIKSNVIQMPESSESEPEKSDQADDNSSEQEQSAQKSVNELFF